MLVVPRPWNRRGAARAGCTMHVTAVTRGGRAVKAPSSPAWGWVCKSPDAARFPAHLRSGCGSIGRHTRGGPREADGGDPSAFAIVTGEVAGCRAITMAVRPAWRSARLDQPVPSTCRLRSGVHRRPRRLSNATHAGAGRPDTELPCHPYILEVILPMGPGSTGPLRTGSVQGDPAVLPDP